MWVGRGEAASVSSCQGALSGRPQGLCHQDVCVFSWVLEGWLSAHWWSCAWSTEPAAPPPLPQEPWESQWPFSF